MKILFLFIIPAEWLFVLTVFSCSFTGYYNRIIFDMPEGSGSPVFSGNALPDYWEVRWYGGECVICSGRAGIKDGDGSICVDVPKEQSVIACAAPVFSEYPYPFRVRPAGIVIPAGTSPPPGTSFSWKDGFAAEFLLSLAEKGIKPDTINVRRFLETIEIKSPENPWELDPLRLYRDITEKELWIYSFREKPVFSVLLPLTDGRWQESSLLSDVLEARNGNCEAELSAGMHYLLSEDCCSCASVYIDPGGDAAVIINTTE